MSNQKVKLTKLRDSDDPLFPKHIPAGYVKEGAFCEAPKVGECFCVGGSWSTSVVQEILSEDTFRTFNSIYKWEMV